MSVLAWFYWDPVKEAFKIPILEHSVAWYGILFMSGFVCGYFILNPIFKRFIQGSRYFSEIDVLNWTSLISCLQISSNPLHSKIKSLLSNFPQASQSTLPKLTMEVKQDVLKVMNSHFKRVNMTREAIIATFDGALATSKQSAYFLIDRLCWFVVVGTVIGARLGAVFLYDWDYFSMHPLEIFKTWHGGLASHGGVVGVIIALFFYFRSVQKFQPNLTFIQLLDFVAIPAALVCCLIRLGNFINQEILGIPTNLPWGVVFGHPADRSEPIPRHPVQLYEAGAYFLIFIVLGLLWKKFNLDRRPGALIGLLFTFMFTSRLFLEFWKEYQYSVIDFSFLQMSQILNIPFIFAGILLFSIAMKRHSIKARS